MMNVVLDTNVFISDPGRIKAPFKVLIKLAKSGKVKIHVPHIVEREFVTQMIQEHLQYLNQVEQSLYALSRKDLPEKIPSSLNEFHSRLPKIKDEIIQHVESVFNGWILEVYAKRHPLNDASAGNVFDAYFKGTPPFKGLKARKDFPDAFIYESIKEILRETKFLHVVSNDKGLRTACDCLGNLSTYESLEDFINSPDIERLLGGYEKAEKIFQRVADYLRDNSDELDRIVEGNANRNLISYTFTDSRIPDDYNEATVSSASDPMGIEYFLDRAKLIGEDIILIPFCFNSIVNAFYYIFKSDYYALSEERTKKISVRDHSRQYYEAEEEFFVEVMGELSLPLAQDRIGENLDSIWDYFEYESSGIETILSVHIIEPLYDI